MVRAPNVRRIVRSDESHCLFCCARVDALVLYKEQGEKVKSRDEDHKIRVLNKVMDAEEAIALLKEYSDTVKKRVQSPKPAPPKPAPQPTTAAPADLKPVPADDAKQSESTDKAKLPGPADWAKQPDLANKTEQTVPADKAKPSEDRRDPPVDEPPAKKNKNAKTLTISDLTKDPQSFVGKRIAKYFEMGAKELQLFFGTIAEYVQDDNEEWWHIVYDDDDSEDMEPGPLLKALLVYKKQKHEDPKNDARKP
jgi:FtsZ-interacting cell division protein ZipA